MEAAGFTKEEVASFESPMGVPIDALTPSEIAVSIVARLISVRRTRSAAVSPSPSGAGERPPAAKAEGDSSEPSKRGSR
jgi:xanthine/CO dehydrogenase XdhC/CoxF family maturation factor